jgi:hypothetical protein
MIHYHGTRIACSDDQCARILKGRHAFVSFADPSQLSIVQEVCQTWALDNGAYSFFNSGKKVDWDDFYSFVQEVRSPSMDFFVIPDVIGGSEEENDALIESCPFQDGIPVYHLHESLSRLEALAERFSMIAFGKMVGVEHNSEKFWIRMHQALDKICDDQGRPKVKIHGLKCLNPQIFTKVPFTSADSTMVGKNIDESRNKWAGPIRPISIFAKAQVLIDRIESFNSPAFWKRQPIQMELI